MEPQRRYVTSGDGVRIAYVTVGEGYPLIVVPGWGYNLEATWEHPEGRPAMERLGQGRLLVHIVHRGIGASQRNVNDLSLDAQVADVGAVADALKASSFDLFGAGDGGAVCVAYSAQHPERVSRLVLWGAYAVREDYAPAAFAATVGLFRDDWEMACRAAADIVFPSGPVELMRWHSNALRESAAPAMAAGHVQLRGEVDVRPYLPQVKAPTLVIHRRGNRDMPISLGNDIAASIPDARMLVVEGEISHPFFGDMSHMDTVTAFLTQGETPRAPDLPSGTAIILFADIADSTGLTERLGDDAFRAKARELDGALRAAIRERDGTPVEGKLLGDGVLAVFTSAREAIEAALACGDAGNHAGLPLHLGIHAGDVIREDNSVYGGAVNIASRIAGLSAAGEVLVSETVRSLARTSAAVEFEDRGEQELKGVGEAVRVWAVVGGGTSNK